MRRHLLHEQGETSRRHLVRQWSKTKGRDHAADAERCDFCDRFGDLFRRAVNKALFDAGAGGRQVAHRHFDSYTGFAIDAVA
jgi:hypothetical protein